MDVDGARMHIHCLGTGSPTVVVELGLSTVASSWSEIHGEMARVTRVCMYDRAGLGYSEPVDRLPVAAEVADRLHGLLAGAGIDDDLVLVGWSAGGLYVREFAHRHPDRVAGMLLIDSSHEQQGDRYPEPLEPNSRTPLQIAKYLAPVGVVRASGMVRARFESFRGSEELKARLVALYEQSHLGATMLREWDAFELDTRAQPPEPLDDLPLIVLSAGKAFEAPAATSEELREHEERVQAIDRELQRELAALSTRGRQIVATGSGHAIHAERPELVVESVRELVELARRECRAPSPSGSNAQRKS